MSTGSSESQYGLRHVICVPVWNGDILTCRDYDTAALWFRAGLKPGEPDRAVARLWTNLQGLAKEVVRTCRPQDFEDARGVEHVLRILRKRCLCQTRTRRFMRATNQASARRRHRRPHLKRAACFPPIDRGSSSCPKCSRRENWSTSPNPPNHLWEFLGLLRLLQNARLSGQERQMVLAGTSNDTEYEAVVTGEARALENESHGSSCRN